MQVYCSELSMAHLCISNDPVFMIFYYGTVNMEHKANNGFREAEVLSWKQLLLEP